MPALGTILSSTNIGSVLADNLVIKSADETVTSSTVLQDDNELLQAVLSGERWQFVFRLAVSADSAADIQFTIVAPTGTTGLWRVQTQLVLFTLSKDVYETTFNASRVGSVSNNGSTTVDHITIDGSITAGDNDNLKLQWAQATSNVTGTVMKAGSTAAFRRVA